MKKRYYYAEHNPYGVNLTYDSIGWTIYRFSSKRDRDTYVDENKWDGCNQINARIRAKNINKILGSSRNGGINVVDIWREEGILVEEIARM